MNIPFLHKKHEVLGVDFGSAGVKFAKLNKKAQSVSQWFCPGSFLSEEAEAVELLKTFLKDNHLVGSTVACNIEDESMKIRRIELPKMPDSDLKEAVRWQLRDVVEGSISDYSVRYTQLEEFQSGEVKKLSLLVYAIRKAAVERLDAFLRRLSFFPLLIEPTSVSLLSTFDALNGWEENQYYGLINLGESQSFFTAMGEGKLLFSRPLIGISGKEFRSSIQKALENDVSQIREVTEKNEAPAPGFHTRIAMEVQRSIDSFTLMYRKDKVHQLFLCGGGATLPGLSESLAKNLAVPTSMLDPTTKFQMSEGPAHLYDVALGLALYS